MKNKNLSWFSNVQTTALMEMSFLPFLMGLGGNILEE